MTAGSSAPLLTFKVHEQMQTALRNDIASIVCSLDLDRTTATVALHADHWEHKNHRYPYPQVCKERTVYYLHEGRFEPVARFTNSLIKLVPTDWGTPTFEIDGIKMLPTAQVSPYDDARRKVALIEPKEKIILDTCGGLGYFASWCLEGGAKRIHSFEKNADVIWLRELNPWSPKTNEVLSLMRGDISQLIAQLPDNSVDAILHDPPRFGIAGELYSQTFYDHLARVLRRKGKLFHYTGTPNKLTSGRDVPNEVSKRLQHSGFKTRLHGDGVLAIKS